MHAEGIYTRWLHANGGRTYIRRDVHTMRTYTWKDIYMPKHTHGGGRHTEGHIHNVTATRRDINKMRHTHAGAYARMDIHTVETGYANDDTYIREVILAVRQTHIHRGTDTVERTPCGLYLYTHTWWR